MNLYVVIFYLGLFISNFSYADDVCDRFLNTFHPRYSRAVGLYGKYEPSPHINFGLPQSVLSLVPEYGSPAYRLPGLSNTILELSFELSYFNWTNIRPIHPLEVLEVINTLGKNKEKLSNLCSRFNLRIGECAAIKDVTEYIQKNIDILQSINLAFLPTSYALELISSIYEHINSMYSQLVTVFHFMGEEHRLSIPIQEAYPDNYSKLRNAKKEIDNYNIDVFIRRKNQSDIWIEFRNTSPKRVESLIKSPMDKEIKKLYPEGRSQIAKEEELEAFDIRELRSLKSQMTKQQLVINELDPRIKPLTLIGLKHIKSPEEMRQIVNLTHDGAFVLYPDPRPFLKVLQSMEKESVVNRNPVLSF